MLDRSKLIHELKSIEKTLFFDNSADIQQARETWQLIANDTTLASQVAAINAPFALPTWEGPIGTCVSTQPPLTEYHILSVDGSQIYPDRHHGPSCFLINIGSIQLNYCLSNNPANRVKLYSQPSIFTAHDQETGTHVSTDMVNCRRQELEFNEGFKQGKALKQQVGTDPLLLLFDGSLIFWLLESKDETLQTLFLEQYINALNNMYLEQIPIAGYISLPKSRELINVIRLVHANFDPIAAQKLLLDQLFDSTLVQSFLKPYERSIIFRNNAPISNQYPEHLRPHFFYINSGTEIGRVETPHWITQNNVLIDQITRIVVDQCKKGYGYPIALAEAHEIAVVKGPDRDFFYHILDKMSINYAQHMPVSQKSRHKKHVGF
jgi:hypothetical protein